MTALLLSVAMLFAAPVLAGRLRSAGGGLQILDGFVLTAITGLVGLHLLPEAIQSAGTGAAWVALAGFLLPAGIERTLRGAHRGAHRLAVVLALAGLLLHAALDGAALEMNAPALATAVVLHRIPVGLLLWITVRPLFGPRAAWAGLLLAAVVTAAGFAAAGSVAAVQPSVGLALFLAFVAGGLLHVLIHQARPAEPVARAGPWGALGALLALALLAAGPAPGGEAAWQILPSLEAAARLLLQAWLPLLLGGVLSALLAGCSRAPELAEIRRGGPYAGLLLALRTPVCSCGTLPVYEDLVRHGASQGYAFSFLLSAPALGLESFLLSLALLGPQVAFARVLLLLVVILTVSKAAPLLLSRRRPAPFGDGEHGERPALDMLDGGRAGGMGRARRILLYLGGDWLDHHAAWLLLGLPLAEAFVVLQAPVMESFADPGPVPAVAATLAVAVLAGAYPMRGVVPVLAAQLALVSWPVGAGGPAMAILVAGPLLSPGRLRLLARLHGRRAAAKAAGLVLALAAGGSLLFHPWTPRIPARPLGQTVTWISGLFAGWGLPGSSSLVLVLGGALALPILVSFVRAGARGWLAEVLPARDHEHPHHPGASHDHRGPEQIQMEIADG